MPDAPTAAVIPAALPLLRRSAPANAPAAPPAVASDLGTELPGFPGARLTIYNSVQACEPAWRDAVASCAGYAFQCFEWQAIFQATIGTAEGVSPYIAHLADRQGRTLLLLPLGIARENGMRVLGFLGGVVTDYGAPLVARDFGAQITAGEIARLLALILKRLPRVDLVWLRRMPETVEGAPNPLAKLRGVEHRESAHALRLPAPEDFKQSANNRRKRRQMARCGTVEFCCPPPDSGAADAIWPVLARQKSRRWRETCCPDLFAEPAYVEFYRRLSHTKWQKGGVHVSALQVGDEVVASHWGVVFAGRFYFLIVGRADGEWARHSPGKLLIEDLVGWCVAQDGIAIFDMTAGDEPYKRDWADHALPLYDYLAPASLRGRLFMAQRRLRECLKRSRWLRNRIRRLRGFPEV